ncbi:MAG: ParB/RepB/Spo0J family partition protein [Candidatus Lariskella arthropodorum]
MAKVRYKDISTALAKLTNPHEISARMSVGLEKNIGEFYYIRIGDLLPFKNQAREHFPQEEIYNLALSIKQYGIRQPLTVIPREASDGKFEVVSGERRLRAAKLVGLEKLPCIVIQDSDLAEEVAIIENIHRQDLHPVELGIAFNSLLRNKIFESRSELSEKLAINESTISECLQFIQLDADLKQYIVKNNIRSRAILRKVIKFKDDRLVLEDLLGIKKSVNKRHISTSVMRVYIENDMFKFQTNGLKKISTKQREVLKLELEKIIQSL